MAKHWYAYVGPQPPSQAQFNAVSNYSYVTLYSPSSTGACIDGPRLCTIYADGPAALAAQPNSPLSPNIRSYIANGLLTSAKFPQAPLKPYVYLKP